MRYLKTNICIIAILGISGISPLIAQIKNTDADLNRSLNTSYPVGSLKGEGTIDLSGSATYSIPIEVPPGTNGVAPNISLVYNSNSGRGLLGMGWSMSGLSAITRVNKTIYHDGTVSPVNFDSNDKFALDGQRLIGISGTYGDNGSTYATESETFATITSYQSGTFSGPGYFRMTTKEGVLYEYGYTSGSANTNASGTHILIWRLNRIQYNDGNYIEFIYTPSNSDAKLEEIKYGGNYTAFQAPYNSIKLFYKSRIDPISLYESGTQINDNYLIDYISVLGEGGVAFKRYDFYYGDDWINTFLNSIQESSGTGTWLNSTLFKYGNEPAAFDINSNSVTPGQNVDIQAGDFNGDGYSDILVNDVFTNGVNYITNVKVYKYDPSSGSFITAIQQNLGANRVKVKKAFAHAYSTFTNDVTGDGIDDLTTATTTGTGSSRVLNNIKIYKGKVGLTAFTDSITLLPYSGYSKTVTDNHFIQAGDFNGDGVGDLLTILGFTTNSATIGVHVYHGKISTQFLTVGTTGTINIPQSLWPTADRIQVMDFNGDSKSDLMVTRGLWTEIFTFDQTYSYKSIYYGSILNNSSMPYFGDFNGDRKMDILYRASLTSNTAQWYKAISTGTGYSTSTITFNHTPQINNYVGDKILTLDANGDGRTDILHAWEVSSSGPSKIDLYFSTGNGFRYEQYSYTVNLNTSLLTPFDINGDGKMEFLTRVNYNVPFNILSFRKNGKELLLEKVLNGYNHLTQFDYKRMNDPSNFYTWSGATDQPVNTISAPMYLASEIKSNNGIGGTTQQLYKYENCKLHKEGKGLLGFTKVKIDNITTGYNTVHENQFNTTYYTAAPLKTQTYYSTTLLNETNYTSQWLALGSGRYHQRVTNVLDNNLFENRSTATTNTYDNYGNIIQSIVDIKANNVTVENINTSYNFGTFGTPVPARPTRVTVTNTRAGQAAFTKVDSMTYNTLGQITGTISFYGAPKSVSQTFGYNTLGNQTSITTNPAGMASRSVSITYDSKGRYPISTINELSQTSSQVVSPLWGKPTSITGIDGLTTSISYDLFGREISRTIPQGYNITTAYDWSTSYANSLYKITASHPGKPDVVTYFDVLGREVYNTKESWLGNLINTQKTYDAKGNLKTSQGPWTTGETAFLTTYNYDSYNRMSSVVNNFGTTSDAYSYSAGNLTTQITNPANQVSSKVTDATGKIISATDYGGTLNYTYYSHGGVSTVIQGANTLITNTYDAQARQTQMVDINAGTIQYKYNAVGILDTQINAKNEMHRMLYDVGNRITQKIMSPEGTVTYEYFPNGSGSSTGKLKKITNYNGVLEEYTYDTYGRVATEKSTVDGVPYTKSFTYNSYDDPTSVTYPSGFGLNYTYDSNGFLQNIKNASNTVTLWTGSTMNGYEQYKTYSLGNGLSSTNTYNFGIPTNFTTSGIQNLSLTWDFASGNLSSRVDAIAGKTENFTYDNLNRLTSAVIPSFASHVYSFATNGNLLTKTDAGTYTYGAAKINAVTQINPSAGNISAASQALPTYTSFLQPASVSEGTYTLNYTYGTDENRIKAVLSQSGTTTNTRYYFGDYEKDITSGVTKDIHYISGGDGLNAIVVRENGTDTYYYTYTDHLGSILHITNNAGSLLATQNFDAWGRGRNTSWGYPSASLPPSLSWLRRGYTSHEHLAEFNLINMNGRLYDPVVGRMLAVDNNIIGETNTQGYNRYSYALNNPLKYTDPDGNNPLLVAALIGAGISVITNGIDNRINGAGFFRGAGKAAVFGAIGGVISAGIGNAAAGFNNLFERSLFQAYAHGFSGAALSMAQGGNPISGFLSGAISSSLGSGISALGMNRAMTGISQFFGGALSGGIGSSMAGGKFWDGVRQGVITGVLNHAAHILQSGDPVLDKAKIYLAEQYMKGQISQYEYILALDVLQKNWAAVGKDILIEHQESFITLGAVGFGKLTTQAGLKLTEKSFARFFRKYVYNSFPSENGKGYQFFNFLRYHTDHIKYHGPHRQIDINLFGRWKSFRIKK